MGKFSSQFLSTTNSYFNSLAHNPFSGMDAKSLATKQLYTSNYPVFLRSNGPYHVYNHFKERAGAAYLDNTKKAKEDAKKRLQDQLEDLKRGREVERDIFKRQVENEEQNFQI